MNDRGDIICNVENIEGKEKSSATYVRVKGKYIVWLELWISNQLLPDVSYSKTIRYFNVFRFHFNLTGKLAALWPFIGICAEVFVLCAIILIYEKRRNKTELEESDTDQSPDQ